MLPVIPHRRPCDLQLCFTDLWASQCSWNRSEVLPWTDPQPVRSPHANHLRLGNVINPELVSPSVAMSTRSFVCVAISPGRLLFLPFDILSPFKTIANMLLRHRTLRQLSQNKLEHQASRWDRESPSPQVHSFPATASRIILHSPKEARKGSCKLGLVLWLVLC